MSKIKVIRQYIKDLSFEIPTAPQIFLTPVDKPQIDLSVDIDVKKLNETTFEVSLKVGADANKKDLFICEVEYAGIFNIEDIEPEVMEQILLVYCPNILFPFVRKIVANCTMDGGFSPLMLDPIDFADLYAKRKSQTVN
ncbi:MAG: protein-export chaperone SecB [Proteobacteria bacterium]|nr:protein-export chaperone SecB [Pseudomonadota bacterium]